MGMFVSHSLYPLEKFWRLISQVGSEVDDKALLFCRVNIFLWHYHRLLDRLFNGKLSGWKEDYVGLLGQ